MPVMTAKKLHLTPALESCAFQREISFLNSPLYNVQLGSMNYPALLPVVNAN